MICFREFHGVSFDSLLGLEALLLGRGDRRMICVNRTGVIHVPYVCTLYVHT